MKKQVLEKSPQASEKSSKKPTDFSYLLRKWTKEEKDLVLNHRMQGLGPKKIAIITGFPIDQVKFWVYGARTKKRSSRNKSKHAANSVRYYYRQKETDWLRWKTQCLRTFGMKKAKDFNLDAPSIESIESWLLACIFECSYCKKQLDARTFGIDHAEPISRGGSLQVENFRECCRSCNLVKGTMNETEFRAFNILINTFWDSGNSIRARLKRGFFRGHRSS